MSTIVTRAGKGSPLTHTEADANFTNLNTDKLEINPALGTPVSGVLTNTTGLPISTGVAGLGANVATALAVAVGSAGAPVVLNGVLGTPSSGVATNLTGTAAGLTAGNVTTNANLTGHVTSVGNAAVLGSFTLAQLNTAISDADVLPLAGANLTGGINSARGNITQHATTMDFFAITSPDILDGTGSAVTITACVNAPQAGATRKFYPIAATILTHGATFDIAGNANLTAAAGDCWIVEAKTVSTYRVTVEKENGTPLVVATNAEAIAGTDTTKPVTSAGLASSLSKSTAGYVQLPGKILIQWGDFSTDTNGDGTASYPVTFTGGVAQIVGNDRNGDTARIVTFGTPGLSSTAGYIVDGFGSTGVSSTASYIVIGWMA